MQGVMGWNSGPSQPRIHRSRAERGALTPLRRRARVNDTFVSRLQWGRAWPERSLAAHPGDMSDQMSEMRPAGLDDPFTIRSVVLGADGSAGSRAALRWASEHVSGEIHVVRAVSPSLELLEAVFQVESTPVLDDAASEIDAAVGALPATVTVTRHVIEDNPPNALLDAAHRFEVDAIVVGSNGHERFGHLVGANIGRLLHVSDVAVVVVPEDWSPMPGSPDETSTPDVVIGVDETPTTDAQLVEWTRSVTGGATPIRLLHAISPTLLAILPTATGSELFENDARERMAALTGDDGTWSTSVVVEHALPALIAASEHASMLVVGSHRSSRMAGFLTGSIAQHLPTMSKCPVAIVPVTEHPVENG